MSPDAAHVTVRFIGEVDDVRAARLIEIMQAELAGRPFDVTWQGLGVFPSARAPRAIWIGAHGAGEPLAALVLQVQRRLEPVAGPPDERPFRAHLTIARVRDRVPRLDWRGVLEACDVEPVVGRVDHVTLYRSTLSPRGPTYTAMARATFA